MIQSYSRKAQKGLSVGASVLVHNNRRKSLKEAKYVKPGTIRELTDSGHAIVEFGIFF